MEIAPLSSALGGEVKGVDLSQEMSAELWQDIHDVWLEYKVLVFRNQDLSEESHLRFAKSFGELQPVRSATHIVGDDQPFMYIANRPVNGVPGILPNGEMHFHNDQSYYEFPCKAAFLHALEIPKQGGNTMFLNTVKAYEMLDNELKEKLSGLSVFNVYDYDRNPTAPSDVYDAEAPQFTHPLVIEPPETGEAALFTSRLMSHHIVGMERAESDALLNQLFDHAEGLALRYEHVWQIGDLVMWDNFASQHARTDFDPEETRVMRRITVAGSRPVGLGVAA